MRYGERKYPAIDILELYSNADSKRWNRWLTRRYQEKDLDGLFAMLYGVQAGMDDLVKKKMNTEKLQLFFIRLQRSVENTIRRVLKEKDPNPCDDPTKARDHLDQRDNKRRRDEMINRILRDKSY